MNKKLLLLLALTIFTIVKSDEFCRVLVLGIILYFFII
jgi:hypothetical protein